VNADVNADRGCERRSRLVISVYMTVHRRAINVHISCNRPVFYAFLPRPSPRHAPVTRTGTAHHPRASFTESGEVDLPSQMVAELLPSFAPVPSLVAAIARQLPASERARLEWFPSAFRTTFVEPLAHAPHGSFHARVDELLVDAVRVVLQLTANLHVVSASLGPQAMTRALEQEELRQKWHDLVPRLLEPVDMAASDDLREAYEWLRAIMSAISITLRDADLQSDGDALTRELELIGDEEIRRALVGEARPFFRGLLLTVGALDVLEGGQVPPAVAEWGRLALEELHVTANALRAMGIPMPTEIQIPGHDATAWRDRRTINMMGDLVGTIIVANSEKKYLVEDEDASNVVKVK
jgi:hypothetical protein